MASFADSESSDSDPSYQDESEEEDDDDEEEDYRNKKPSRAKQTKNPKRTTPTQATRHAQPSRMSSPLGKQVFHANVSVAVSSLEDEASATTTKVPDEYAWMKEDEFVWSIQDHTSVPAPAFLRSKPFLVKETEDEADGSSATVNIWKVKVQWERGESEVVSCYACSRPSRDLRKRPSPSPSKRTIEQILRSSSSSSSSSSLARHSSSTKKAPTVTPDRKAPFADRDSLENYSAHHDNDGMTKRTNVRAAATCTKSFAKRVKQHHNNSPPTRRFESNTPSILESMSFPHPRKAIKGPPNQQEDDRKPAAKPTANRAKPRAFTITKRPSLLLLLLLTTTIMWK